MQSLTMTSFEEVVILVPAARYNAEIAAATATHAEALADAKRALENMAEQLMQANETIQQQQSTMQENERIYAEALRRNEGLLKTNRDQSEMLKTAAAIHQEKDAEIERLKQRIAELTPAAPPVIVEPKPEEPKPVPVNDAPIITKTRLENVRGVCVTLGLKAPSPTVDATARELIQLAARMGFNVVRFFRNRDEVRDDLKRSQDDPRNLYAVARKLGLAVVADTINRAGEMYSDTDLSQYLAGLKSMGAAALVFDDANQYTDSKNDDGSLKWQPGFLENMVRRVRERSDLPLIASVRANAAVGAYKPLFDFVEFQTFGRLSELDDYLKRPADCFVLDGQQSIGLDYLRGAHDVILKYPPAAAFWYSALDQKTDWREMPDKVALIEKTVQAMKDLQTQKQP